MRAHRDAVRTTTKPSQSTLPVRVLEAPLEALVCSMTC
jgi:hypothetical protein